MANSILNGYLIGIEFVQCFVKVLYKHQIQFEDLENILEYDVLKNYKDLLGYSADEIAEL